MTPRHPRHRSRLAVLLHGLLAAAFLLAGILHAPSPALAQAPAQDDPPEPCLTDDPFDLEDLRTALSAEDPPRGVQRINEHLSVEFIGTGDLDEGEPTPPEEQEDEPPDEGEEEPAPGDTLYREMQFAVFNTNTKNEFRVVMLQAMLDAILECHQEDGRTSATEGFDDLEDAEQLRLIYIPALNNSNSDQLRTLGAPRPEGAVSADAPTGWSNGIDTRIMRTLTTSWPLRTIAQFRYGNVDESRCTGTLIGPRHLITAAHCINAQGTNNWFTIRVAPGKNGVGNEPYGNSLISLTPPPGTEAWYFTPWQWRNPLTTHSQWDWGLIVIPNRLGNQTGWMGYVARSGNALKSVSNYNRGYPLCNTDRNNQPANCQDARLYGDVALCGIGNFYNKGPDGWNRRITVSCDASAGHSGSAVYHYFFDTKLNKWVPVVSMVMITESCTTCGPLVTYPNANRRITPGDLGVISWLRETFP